VPKVEGDITTDPLARQLSALAVDLDATVVVGSAERIGDNFRVMTTVWHPDGSPGARYHKNHRVPFGEYVPFRPVIERLADISPIPRDAVAGDSPPVLDTPAGTLGVAVSYEVFFPSRTREAVRRGAEVILVPTNATSFSTTQMPALELGAARLRALETGRAVVQSAPTGFSGVVDADGRVVAASDLGARQLLEVEVSLRTGRTPYSRTGDLPWVGLAMVALAAGLAVAGGAEDPLRPRRSASPARR
jgi:apolipoprotein N-acyltransferase